MALTAKARGRAGERSSGGPDSGLAVLRVSKNGFRGAAAIAVWLAYLALPSIAMAQSDDSGVDELRKETAQLRRSVADQERRIAELEKTVKALAAISAPVPQRIPPTTPPWRLAANWALIRKGMSEAQVVEILGPPARVQSVTDERKLYYQPDARTGSSPHGTITLIDDRVTASEPPPFPLRPR